jgi:hypothetical protein
VYSGTAQNYSTTILQSRFPISITVTPAANYQVSTTSSIAIAGAANMQITLALIMNSVLYNVTAAGIAYAGALTVLIKDVNSATIYSGTAASWSSTTPAMGFPLSITVTPNATYQVFTQTGIASMTNLQITLVPYPTSPIVYSVLAAGSAYSGAITVVVTDST